MRTGPLEVYVKVREPSKADSRLFIITIQMRAQGQQFNTFVSYTTRKGQKIVNLILELVSN